MSEPSYRIDLKYEPQYETISGKPWSGYVTRLSDDRLVAVGLGVTSLEAGINARDKIGALDEAERLTELMQPIYLDEDGALTHAPMTPEPQSLRA